MRTKIFGIVMCIFATVGLFFLTVEVAEADTHFHSSVLVPLVATATPNNTSHNITTTTSNGKSTTSSTSSVTQFGFQDYLLSLFSGLVGAGIGGGLTYIGSIKAAKKQIDYLKKQEEESRDRVEQRQKAAMIYAFYIELNENINLAPSSSSKANSKTNNTLLSTEVWAIYKADIRALPATSQAKLFNAYADIKRFNGLVEFDRLKLAPGQVPLQSQINQLGQSVKESCQKAKDEIDKDKKIELQIEVSDTPKP